MTSPKTPLERVVTSETLVSEAAVSRVSSGDGAQSDHSSQSNATGRSVGSHVLVCGQLPKKSGHTQSMGHIVQHSSGMSVVSAATHHTTQSSPATMPPVVTENNDSESYPLTAGAEPPRFGSRKKPTINERMLIHPS